MTTVLLCVLLLVTSAVSANAEVDLRIVDLRKGGDFVVLADILNEGTEIHHQPPLGGKLGGTVDISTSVLKGRAEVSQQAFCNFTYTDSVAITIGINETVTVPWQIPIICAGDNVSVTVTVFTQGGNVETDTSDNSRTESFSFGDGPFIETPAFDVRGLVLFTVLVMASAAWALRRRLRRKRT